MKDLGQSGACGEQQSLCLILNGGHFSAPAHLCEVRGTLWLSSLPFVKRSQKSMFFCEISHWVHFLEHCGAQIQNVSKHLPPHSSSHEETETEWHGLIPPTGQWWAGQCVEGFQASAANPWSRHCYKHHQHVSLRHGEGSSQPRSIKRQMLNRVSVSGERAWALFTIWGSLAMQGLRTWGYPPLETPTYNQKHFDSSRIQSC